MMDTESTNQPAVLVARCDNYREDVDQACHGEIRFRWGMSQSDPCDTCGARCGIAVAAWERVELAGAVPDTGQARDDIRGWLHEQIEAGGDPMLARVLDALNEPSGATVQTPHVADLAYARSEVDKWLASGDPYCILPTRTEHIPALLARLDELEGIV